MNKLTSVLIVIAAVILLQCGKKEENQAALKSESKGVGAVTKVELGQIDPGMVKEGEALFTSKCIVCHKMDEKLVGPSLTGITRLRTPEWIMNMILNPEEMTRKDEVAKELLKTYMTQMTFQNLTEKEARSLLEYFREIDSKLPQ